MSGPEDPEFPIILDEDLPEGFDPDALDADEADPS